MDWVFESLSFNPAISGSMGNGVGAMHPLGKVELCNHFLLGGFCKPFIE